MSGIYALPPDVLAQIKAGFFEECEELLAELETGLLALKAGERDPEIVNTVFRAAHSIKGGGASFGLDPLVHFAHRMESVLAAVRSKTLALDTDVLTVLLKAADVLADHVHAAREGRESADQAALGLEQALDRLIPHDAEVANGSSDAFPGEDSFTPIPAEAETLSPGASQERRWTIRFRPNASLYANANEPLTLLRELERLGPIQVALNDDELPLLDELSPEDAYLLWTVSLKSPHDERAIRSVFEFVETDCEIEILPVLEKTEAPAPSLARNAPSPSVDAAKAIAVAPAGTNASRLSDTIRVDLERVDQLINLVSELVINQSMLAQRLSGMNAATAPGAELPLDELNHLTRELQDSVMAIRAQPVKVVFQRMSRLVREVEALTGKHVNLVIEGESTEVDRTVIERLVDPLTHMIRNAVDHGIESSGERLKAGKPAQGTVRLSAAHRGGRIVIEVADDGNGIDRDRVLAIAKTKGLVPADASLGDNEIDNLIFLPGFTTNGTVSELSGRGVGMDVVKSGVQALGGRISLNSSPGQGTVFVLSLPLTLAVLDGMLVTVCGHSLIAPLTTLLETIQPRPEDMRALGAHATFLNVRGDQIPVIDLGVALHYRTQTPCRGIILLVEDDSGRRAGLLVDEVLGQRQVVIKSIEINYQAVNGIAAATILGDGRVALILDVNGILLFQGHRPEAAERLRHAG